MTGGTVISSELGYELKDTTMDMLGRAKSVKVQKENTVIVDGEGDKEALQSRIAQIKKQIEETTSISTERNYRRDWLSCPVAWQSSV